MFGLADGRRGGRAGIWGILRSFEKEGREVSGSGRN